MNFKGAMLGVMSLAASLSVSAQTVDYGSFVLDFDTGTEFGTPSADFSGANGLVSLSWAVSGAVHLAVNGGMDFVEFALPSFTITANSPAYHLSGPVSGFFGNLVFSEFGESQTFASIDGELSVNGSGAIAVGGDLTRTVTTNLPGVFTGGYYSTAASAAFGEFSTLAFSNGHLNLVVFGTGAILAQPQNALKVSFFAAPAPVPVPTAGWLLGSALSALGFVRRRNA